MQHFNQFRVYRPCALLFSPADRICQHLLWCRHVVASFFLQKWFPNYQIGIKLINFFWKGFTSFMRHTHPSTDSVHFIIVFPPLNRKKGSVSRWYVHSSFAFWIYSDVTMKYLRWVSRNKMTCGSLQWFVEDGNDWAAGQNPTHLTRLLTKKLSF